MLPFVHCYSLLHKKAAAGIHKSNRNNKNAAATAEFIAAKHIIIVINTRRALAAVLSS